MSNPFPKNIQKRDTGGFTIIEGLVASTMFITALLLISGALLSLETSSRKARATRVAMDNVSAAIDSMSRTLRMGTSYHCGTYTVSDIEFSQDCEMSGTGGGGASSIAFERQGGAKLNPNDQYVYALQGTSIVRSTDGGANWVAMTAPEITITKLTFWVGGTTIGANQSYAIMVVEGSAGGADLSTQTTFNIQTLISQRTPNLF